MTADRDQRLMKLSVSGLADRRQGRRHAEVSRAAGQGSAPGEAPARLGGHRPLLCVGCAGETEGGEQRELRLRHRMVALSSCYGGGGRNRAWIDTAFWSNAVAVPWAPPRMMPVRSSPPHHVPFRVEHRWTTDRRAGAAVPGPIRYWAGRWLLGAVPSV